jgi:hypothetical protein
MLNILDPIAHRGCFRIIAVANLRAMTVLAFQPYSRLL